MENSIKFFLNTHLEWSLSCQDLVITILGIESKLSMVFYSQTDGQTERVNQELEQYLRMFIDYR